MTCHTRFKIQGIFKKKKGHWYLKLRHFVVEKFFLKYCSVKEKRQGKQCLEATEWKIKLKKDSKSVFHTKARRRCRC